MKPFEVAEIDRSVFEAIRLELVSAGYLPNVANYLIPDTADAVDIAAYTAAKKELSDDDHLIDLYGVGNYKSKQEKLIPKIVVLRKGIDTGSLGGMHATYYEQSTFKLTPQSANSVGFIKYKYPTATKHIQYDIRIVCDTAELERIMLDIVYKALGEFKQMNPVLPTGSQDSERSFMIRSLNAINITSSDIIEWSLPYTVQDVWLSKGTLVKGNIVKLSDYDGSVVVVPPLTPMGATGSDANAGVPVVPSGGQLIELKKS